MLATRNPERPVRILEHRRDRIAFDGGVRRHSCRSAIRRDAEDSCLVRSCPDASVTPPFYGSDASVEHVRRDLDERVALGSPQPGDVADPRCAGRVDEEIRHALAWCSILERKVLEFAVAKTNDVPLGSLRPQRSFASFAQLDDSIAWKLGRADGIEDGESNAVEAYEAVERCNPDVAGAVLQDGVDRVDGESVFHGPRLMDPRSIAGVGR